MALTAIEELTIVNGAVGPDSNPLAEYVHQIGVQYAEDFMKEYKVFPTVDEGGNTINQLATAYLNKMISACSKMFAADGASIQRLTRIIVVKIGEVAPNYAAVENATDAEWESFLNGVMLDSFEIALLVRIEEKSAYDAIVVA